MRTTAYVAFGVLTVVGAGAACSSSGGNKGVGFGGAGAGAGAVAGTGGDATGGTGNTTSTGGSGISIDAGVGGSGAGPTACDDQGVADFDNDGFTVADGDCNNCDANANPGAYDVPGNNIDEDCNGIVDDTVTDCDSGIPDVAYTDPFSAAEAIGLCHKATATDKKWGVISATYVKANGAVEPINPVSHGLVDGWGPNVNVQQGQRMLALSSGAARQPTDPGYQSPGGYDTGIMGTAPNGFPIDSPACSIQTANDKTTWNPVALELKVRVPTNAKSFSFNFNFYTYEWPVYVCSQYNDFFVALQEPAPPSAQSGNISFDSQGNPVSVNNGFLEVCQSQNAGGKFFPCTLGPTQLQGTGFEGHAATGWLETQSPVTPGSEVTLRFAIWDMGDPVLDSTVLIDKFQFSAEEAKEPGTKPVPVPQ